MRTLTLLDHLMPEIRQRILEVTLSRPQKLWYLRELAEFLNVAPSSLQRELANLTDAGILLRTVNGNRTYFQANQACPVFPELQQLLNKTLGFAEVLKQNLSGFKHKIELAFVYGSMASGTANSDSDIDLLIVGQIGLGDMAATIKKAELKLGRPINPFILSADEARKRLRNKDHFLTSVRNADKLFLIGKDHELGRAFS
jgi:predicted nucleotidyltransferase